MHIQCDHEHLGFKIKTCSHHNQCYLHGVIPKLLLQEEIENALSAAQDASCTQDKPLIHISIAPEKEHTLQQHMPQMHIDQLRSVVSALHEIKYGTKLDKNDDLTDDEIVMAINSKISPTLHKKSMLTCSKLKQEVDWGEWLAAEKVQLNSMEDLN
eukprot:13334245-Ditylum_brightwellii.AAC.1